MRTAYHVLAYLIALEVVIQAAAISFAVFGLGKWITDGGVMDKATMESHSAEFPGVIGFAIHGFNGQNVVPLVGILLLLVSFFAKVPRGIMWAGLVLVLILVQVFLGIFGAGIPELGVLHGLNALVLFSVAVIAARQARLPAELSVAAPVGAARVS